MTLIFIVNTREIKKKEKNIRKITKKKIPFFSVWYNVRKWKEILYEKIYVSLIVSSFLHRQIENKNTLLTISVKVLKLLWNLSLYLRLDTFFPYGNGNKGKSLNYDYLLLYRISMIIIC